MTLPVSSEAGVTGHSALTLFVRRAARGELPEQTFPILAAAALLPISPRPGKIGPTTIRQTLRRLITKVLLPMALDDTRDFLSPEQLEYPMEWTPSSMTLLCS